MKNIKIGIIGYNPKKIGGIESFSRTLANILDYKVEYIYEYDENGPFTVEHAFPVLKYNFINRVINKITNQSYSLLKIKKILLAENFDIVILNSPKYLAIVPDLSKTILIQHTTAKNWWESKYKFNRNKNLLNLSFNVHKIISLSSFEKVELIKKFNYPSHLLETINMINPLPISNSNKTNKNKLIMLTRFQNSIKRIDLVINSMHLLPDFELNIYGDGPDKADLLKLAKSKSNVIIHPSTTEKIKVLDASGIYILSSEFEGFPVSLIEAMSRGLPLIVRNSFLSAPCFINKNGVLLPKLWSSDNFKNAVLFCYSNYNEFSNKSVEIAANYSAETIKINWQNLLNEIIFTRKQHEE
ncbi:glycosyltransferase [Providencia rettgeri]|uniref:glycosyltransferase n=1 Tax=unclassified Providencia TaxID=2633465 RepID=UPI00234B52DC|nr:MULTISPECIES: glycosyltransferase [unclassified Providencia]